MHRNKHKKLYTFAILLAIATVIIHLINRFIVASASLKDILDVINRKYFKSKFGNIYYTKRGKGSPVLLIHDSLPGSSGYEWNKVDKLLATEHTVYTIDLLGYGRSDKPGMTYTNYVFVQLLHEFVNKVIGEKTDVIVSGYSSSFVIMASNNKKDLFNRIILINPSNPELYNKAITTKDQVINFLLKMPVFGTLLYHIYVSRETSAKMFAEKMYHNPAHVDQDMVDAYHEAAHKGGYYAKYLFASLISKKLNTNITHGVHTLENETLILAGESESNITSTIATYKEFNPAIKSEIISNAKRYPHIETPEAFLNHVGSFFKK